jgi:acyl carrier protein
MNHNIFEVVAREISRQLPGHADITREQSLKEDLGLSSIKMVLVLTSVTGKLDIDIMNFTDYELLRMKTVGDLTDLLQSQKGASHEHTN